MSRIENALNKAVGAQAPAPAPRKASVPPPSAGADEVAASNLKEHMLQMAAAPKSQVSEEYRKLKEAFIRAASREGFDNVVLVTSANPKEGKSVTTLNLAISLAQEFDYTVLVVDADLRAPVCHKYLGIDAGPGLSDCLEGRATCGEVLVKTGVGRLVLMPAGKPVANPAELLASNKMRQLLQELKHRYPDRFILIDSPPAKLFAETRALAAVADATILVVREGVSSVEDVSETVGVLDHKVMGIVYNDAGEAPFRKAAHYYQYAYSQPEGAGQ